MGMKKAQFIIKGMNRDLSVSKFNPQYAYENFNMRIAATDDNDSFSLVNEKGNRKASITWTDDPTNHNSIAGTPIGQQVLGDSLILFTTTDTNQIYIYNANTDLTINNINASSSTISDITLPNTLATQHVDRIYKFWMYNGDLNGKTLYFGDLGFASNHPIDSIAIYENEELQKVYWVDGENMPRVINVSKVGGFNSDVHQFDFIRTLRLDENVSIQKNYTSDGVFAPGTIQYCLTYYSLYGQQSNIFYSSPLYYISYTDRGANPTDTVSNSFTITISNADDNFDFVRIYSILRTSIDATPQVRVVANLAVPSREAGDNIVFIDNGTTGYSIDPTELLYVGGKEIIAGSISQKDNTLFLGNIETKDNKVPSEIKSMIQDTGSPWINAINFSSDEGVLLSGTYPLDGNYLYSNQLNLNSQQITTLKNRDYYRFGIQFQDKLGNWSEVCYIGDKKVNRGSYLLYNNGQFIFHPVRATLVMGTAASTLLRNSGYVKARPVIVYPDVSEREVICQGVLNPTVFNVEDRYNNAPFAQASWFFRPNAYTNVTNLVNTDTFPANKGHWAEFRHFFPIPGCRSKRAEIQCISVPPSRPVLGETTPNPNQAEGHDYTESTDPATWVSENKECYYIDQSILTFHSPDIEFNKEVQNLNMSSFKVRLTGLVKIHATTSDIDIQTSTPPLPYVWGDKKYSDIAPGFYKEPVQSSLSDNSIHGWKSMLSGIFWLDELYGAKDNNYAYHNVGFAIYPWHRNGSLNNTREVPPEDTKSSMLKKKKMSILRFSVDTALFDSPYDFNSKGQDTKIDLYNSDEPTLIKLQRVEGGDVTYQGNIDKVVIPHTASKGGNFDNNPDTYYEDSQEGNTTGGYPIVAARIGLPDASKIQDTNFRAADSHELFVRSFGVLKERFRNRSNPSNIGTKKYVQPDVQSYSINPVSIKYKSTPHAVISLLPEKEAGVYQLSALPVLYNPSDSTQGINLIYSGSLTGNTVLFWDKNKHYRSYETPILDDDCIGSSVLSNLNTGWLYLGEIYRDVNTNTIFGGKTEEALEANSWIIAGPAVRLSSTGNTTIKWCEGDTYYQRYDCLKTYPFTMEDQNSVVDILSFMCETRVNIDGRYDRNRGQASNLYMSPKNFNLINPAYSQHNNFFQYRTINANKLRLNKFPNTITWTKTKTLGEEVDTWTNITLAATLDLDGDKGEINSLKKFNNDIIAFQDTGISQILYNDNVQIAATTGVPIEIANSGKVSGKRYISDKIGCTNKWSICSTPLGIYFADNINKDLYVFNGNIQNISDTKGFHSWTVNNLPSLRNDTRKYWTPATFDNVVTYYDPINGDVMFINYETCLAYSEPLGEFSSFYSYDRSAYFASLNGVGITWRQEGNDTSSSYYPWIHREGEFNSFFGVTKPFYTTVVVNPDPTEDKIFNNVEFRADSFSGDTYVPRDTFDKLITWNEYQKGESVLSDTIDKPSTLKKKFRVWRANIPRWNTIRNTGITPNHRDRMRNPWLYLTLKKENPNNYKTVLHDIVVDYFE